MPIIGGMNKKRTNAMTNAMVVEPDKPHRRTPLRFVNSGFPNWLNAPPSTTQKDEYQLDVFYDILEKVACGNVLKNICEDNPEYPSFARLKTWLNMPENSEYAAQFEEAEQISMDYLGDTLQSIAAGDDDFEDVARSALKVKTIQWLMEKRYKDRYAPAQNLNINQSVSLDLTGAMERAARAVDMRQGVTIEGETD